jgi:CBS domain-containing protein
VKRALPKIRNVAVDGEKRPILVAPKSSQLTLVGLMANNELPKNTAYAADIRRHVPKKGQKSPPVGDSCDKNPPYRLADFLYKVPVSVLPDTPVGQALQVMADSRIGSVVIVAPEDGRPVGIFTLRDVLCRVAIPAVGLELPISALMTLDPLAVSQSITVGQAAREMGRSKLRHLLVTDAAGALAGIVSRTDIYEWMCDSCAAIRRAKAVQVSVIKKSVPDGGALVV